MYLYFFERIVRAASGDPNFALPYWDYAPAANRTLPTTVPKSEQHDQSAVGRNPAWDERGRDAAGFGGQLDNMSGTTQLPRRRTIPGSRPRNAAQCCP